MIWSTLELRRAENAGGGAGINDLAYFTRDNTGKSTLADPMTQAITRRPDGGGVYRLGMSILNANVTKMF